MIWVKNESDSPAEIHIGHALRITKLVESLESLLPLLIEDVHVLKVLFLSRQMKLTAGGEQVEHTVHPRLLFKVEKLSGLVNAGFGLRRLLKSSQDRNGSKGDLPQIVHHANAL